MGYIRFYRTTRCIPVRRTDDFAQINVRSFTFLACAAVPAAFAAVKRALHRRLYILRRPTGKKRYGFVRSVQAKQNRKAAADSREHLVNQNL